MVLSLSPLQLLKFFICFAHLVFSVCLVGNFFSGPVYLEFYDSCILIGTSFFRLDIFYGFLKNIFCNVELGFFSFPILVIHRFGLFIMSWIPGYFMPECIALTNLFIHFIPWLCPPPDPSSHNPFPFHYPSLLWVWGLHCISPCSSTSSLCRVNASIFKGLNIFFNWAIHFFCFQLPRFFLLCVILCWWG